MSTSPYPHKKSQEEIQALMQKMITLKLLTKGEDSTDGSPLYTPTPDFEKFLLQSRDALLSEAGQVDMLVMGLILQTGSLEMARLYFISTIIAEYIGLSDAETDKRQPELIEYANVLFQIGSQMQFLKDWK